MGRAKKYTTEEERVQAQKNWSHNYYVRNKKAIDEKAKAKYRKRVDNM